MDKYTIISDLHLGTKICKVDAILEFLENLQTECLILNGDILDNLDFRRLNHEHWNVIKKIRQISKHTKVIWISGNHDYQAEGVAAMLGAPFLFEYTIETKEKKILVTHGDRFDKIIQEIPLLARMADNIYRIIQLFDKRLDNNYYYSGMVKRNSSTIKRSTTNTVKNAINYAKKHHYDAIIMGHLHHPSDLQDTENWIQYVNSGSWTEHTNCHYVTISADSIELKEFIPTNTGEKNDQGQRL